MEQPLTKVRDLLIDVNSPDAEVIFKALGNALRLRILTLLARDHLAVTDIISKLELPASTVNQHLKVLEEAGLIQTFLRPATRGTEKVCAKVYQKLQCELVPQAVPPERAVEISMPVGAYVDFEVTRPCGLASASNIIGLLGDPEAFLEPSRIDAQLLWFATGFVEYRFPKKLPPRSTPESLSLSMEICSEAAGYAEDWPSDITLWINGVEIGTWTSPGDFGEEHGLLNPDWWSSKNTQHGLLKIWQVTGSGSFIDGLLISQKTIADLSIEERPYISVRIGVKPDAEYQGGVNLFGRYFGNYPQDIVLRLVYDKRELRG
jgi:predicted transcriptional regulator